MCGIVGYVGKKDCTKVLLDSLSKLEYRGYDSAGIAVFENDAIKTKKTKGRLADLEEKLKREGWLNGTCGIGHTRWATHGEPSDINSHPHGNANISIVHNGIIENYRTIKDFLLKKGYVFESQTDTETVAKLLDYYYDGDPMATIQKVLAEIEGSYALGIIFKDFPRRIYAVRKDSPLIVAVGEDEAFIASDVPAILKYTKNYYLLDENEIAVLDDGKVEFFDVHGMPVEKEMLVADFDMEAAEKGGYAHFMLKEIHEQPTAIKTTITPRIVDGMPNLEECGLTYDRAITTSSLLPAVLLCTQVLWASMFLKRLAGYLLQWIWLLSSDTEILSLQREILLFLFHSQVKQPTLSQPLEWLRRGVLKHFLS